MFHNFLTVVLSCNIDTVAEEKWLNCPEDDDIFRCSCKTYMSSQTGPIASHLDLVSPNHQDQKDASVYKYIDDNVKRSWKTIQLSFWLYWRPNLFSWDGSLKKSIVHDRLVTTNLNDNIMDSWNFHSSCSFTMYIVQCSRPQPRLPGAQF